MLWQDKDDEEHKLADRQEAEAVRAAADSAKEEDDEANSTKPFDIHFVHFQGNRFRIREFKVTATVADVKKEVCLMIRSQSVCVSCMSGCGIVYACMRARGRACFAGQFVMSARVFEVTVSVRGRLQSWSCAAMWW